MFNKYKTPLLILLLAVVALAEEKLLPETPMQPQFGFDRFMNAMLKFNPDLSIAKAQWLARHEGLISAWGSFEPKLVADYQRQNSTPAIDHYNNWREEYKVGVQGSMPWSGTQYDAYSRYQGYHERTTPSTIFVGATLKQPIGRDFWFGSSMINVDIAKHEREKAYQRYRSTLAEYMDQLLTAYWEFYASTKQLSAESESELMAEQLDTDAKLRLDQGKASPLDVQRAQSELVLRRSRRIDAQKMLASRRSELLLLAADPELMTVKYFGVRPNVDSIYRYPAVDSNSADQLIAIHPDYLAQKAEVTKQNRVVQYHRGQQLPVLNVSGTVGVQASAGNADLVFDRFAETGLRERVLGIGINFEMPITGNVKARYAASAEKQNLLIAERQLALIHFQIKENMDILQQQLRQLADQLQYEKSIGAFHQEEWSAEYQKMQAGKSSLVQIYEIEEKWREAQKRALAMEKAWHITGMRILRAKGTLLSTFELEQEQPNGNKQLKPWLLMR